MTYSAIAGNRDTYLRTCAMPTLLRCTRTKETVATVTIIGASPHLLSIIGKAFACVALACLQTLASCVYRESQCGFRSGQSTVDMIFSIRQLQEKCQEQQMQLHIAFIDLTKVFDLVSRSGLFKLL